MRRFDRQRLLCGRRRRKHRLACRFGRAGNEVRSGATQQEHEHACDPLAVIWAEVLDVTRDQVCASGRDRSSHDGPILFRQCYACAGRFRENTRLHYVDGLEQLAKPFGRAVAGLGRVAQLGEDFGVRAGLQDEELLGAVHLEDDAVFLDDDLAERCRAGVEVNLLIDSHGAKIPRDPPVLLREAGCNLEFFRGVNLFHLFTPWRLARLNYRNHRRVLVIDGKVGFTGGHGVSGAWAGDGRQEDHWRETDVRVQGPIVQQLQAAFVDLWLEATGNVLGGDRYFPRLKPEGTVHAQVVKSSPYGGSFESYLLYLLSINSAQKTIYITTPYFLPDERMQEAILNAVRRGVRVVALTPGTLDHRLVYWASRRVFGNLLVGKSAGPGFVYGNVGLGILTDTVHVLEQQQGGHDQHEPKAGLPAVLGRAEPLRDRRERVEPRLHLLRGA